MTALGQPNFITIADYLATEEKSDVKHEYLGDTVRAMAGATNRHNGIVGNGFASLHGQLRGKTCRPFNSDTKIRIEFPDHTRLYYPDAMVVCQTNPEFGHFQDQPVVVIEVLSDSTRRTDLGEKRDAYLTLPSLKVLLLVEPDAPSVLVHRRKLEGGFAIEHYHEFESITPLPEIEAFLPLSDLYDRVDFYTGASA